MRGGQIHFFATSGDIRQVLVEFESTQNVKYIPGGHHDTQVVAATKSLLDDPKLGVADSGDNTQCTYYVVCARELTILTRRIDRYDGTTVYSVDLGLNLHAIILRPSGVYEPDCIIDGNAGFISDDPRARELFSALKKIIRKRFTFLHTHYVGLEALSLLDKGWRLTQGVRRPKKWDLTRAGRGVE